MCETALFGRKDQFCFKGKPILIFIEMFPMFLYCVIAPSVYYSVIPNVYVSSEGRHRSSRLLFSYHSISHHLHIIEHNSSWDEEGKYLYIIPFNISNYCEENWFRLTSPTSVKPLMFKTRVPETISDQNQNRSFQLD